MSEEPFVPRPGEARQTISASSTYAVDPFPPFHEIKLPNDWRRVFVTVTVQHPGPRKVQVSSVFVFMDRPHTKDLVSSSGPGLLGRILRWGDCRRFVFEIQLIGEEREQ